MDVYPFILSGPSPGSSEGPTTNSSLVESSCSSQNTAWNDRQSPASLQTIDSSNKKQIKAQKSKQRSRRGCEKCKLRRIKCDELKPKCSKCLERGYKCNYKIALSFREDYINRGLMFGREGLGSKKRRSPIFALDSSSTHFIKIRHKADALFINFDYSDFGYLNVNMETCPQPRIMSPDILSAIDDLDAANFALSYYIDYVSPIFNPLGEKDIPFFFSKDSGFASIKIQRGLSIPDLFQFSQKHPHVWFSVLALGSMFLYNRSGSRYWHNRSHIFKLFCLNFVKRSIIGLENPSSTESDSLCGVDVLLSYVLLMLYEVANNCDKKWRSYLRLSKSLINCPNFVDSLSSVERSVSSFSLQVLHYQETSGRTACRDKNSFFLGTENYLDNELDQEARCTPNFQSIPMCISWVGCDWRLIDVISDITDLSLERSNRGLSPLFFHSLCERLKRRLNNMAFGVPLEELIRAKSFKSLDNSVIITSEQFGIPNNVKSEEALFLLACEVKRLASVIYMECCLLDGTPEDQGIERLVTEIYQALEFLIMSNDLKWVSILLWPLFIVSVEVSVFSPACDEFRYSTLKMLQRISSKGNGSVDMTKDVIIGIWKLRDLNNSHQRGPAMKYGIETLDERKNWDTNRSFNDWEMYVVNESYKIALA